MNALMVFTHFCSSNTCITEYLDFNNACKNRLRNCYQCPEISFQFLKQVIIKLHLYSNSILYISLVINHCPSDVLIGNH